MGEEIWNKYLKFTVIRDPFDRMVSLFFHLGVMRGGLEPTPANFKAWLKQRCASLEPFFLIKGKFAIDRVIRFENMAEDIDGLCQELDIPPLSAHLV